MHRKTNSSGWRGRTSAACRVVAGMLVFIAVGSQAQPVLAAGPDTVGQCDRPANFGPDAQVKVTQQKGRALIEISKPNTAGRKLEVEYGDELYSQKFSADGTIRLGFVLTAQENRFSLTMSETSPVTCNVSVPDFNKIYRAVLRWHDPVQLDLFVLEPGGRPGEIGGISGARPNIDHREGIGHMDIIGGVPAEDATGEMSYVADASAIPPDGVFGFKVDFVSRGSQAEQPYCDDNPLATPRIEFIKIEGGKVSIQRLSLNRARCRDKIPENRRLMPIR